MAQKVRQLNTDILTTELHCHINKKINLCYMSQMSHGH